MTVAHYRLIIGTAHTQWWCRLCGVFGECDDTDACLDHGTCWQRRKADFDAGRGLDPMLPGCTCLARPGLDVHDASCPWRRS